MALVLPLRTARLELRAFLPGDVDAMHRVYGDPEVMAHVGDGPATDRGATAAMLAGYGEHQRRHGFAFWAVVERATGDLVGDAGLARPAPDEVELGYTLGRAWWGRGYATEAAGACLRAAFDPLGLEEVVALAEPANAASTRVLVKLGMREDGTRLAYGRPHALYRLRAGDWRGRS